jgi:hypothetical protein
MNTKAVSVIDQMFQYTTRNSSSVHSMENSTSLRTCRPLPTQMSTSFGFGQKCGIVLAVAPTFLFAAITEEKFNTYRKKFLLRQEKANRNSLWVS